MYGLILTAALAAAHPAPAFAQEPHRFDIATTDAVHAIHQFGVQANVQILASADQLKGKSLNEVAGTHTTDSALRLLLVGTGLTHRYVGNRTVALVAQSSEPREAAGATNSAADTREAPNKSLWERFRLAQVEQAKTATGDPVERSGGGSRAGAAVPVEEVVVTAQKREERLQDVPVPVTAVNPQELLDSNTLRIQDYSTRIPGLSVTPGAQSVTVLAIRGITTGVGANPTVGISIDDVPFGSSTQLGGGGAIPDMDPGDLQRIEVLRGPQGTLYGANSLGGLLKFVTVDPSPDRMSGRLQVDTSSIEHGSELGYGLRGSLNVPVSDTFAVRASAYGRRDPGYIDDPGLGTHDVNSADVYGGRLSALWQLSDAISLKLGGLYQRTEVDGSPDSDPAVGDMKQLRVPGTGWYDRELQAYSAVLTASVGAAELAALSGYNVSKFFNSLDAGFAYAGLVRPVFGAGSGAQLLDDNKASKFSQELRLSTPLSEKVDLLIGGFYTDEDSSYIADVQALTPATGAILGSYRKSDFPTTYQEYAGFADLTVHFTDRIDVQVGARQSEIKQTYTQAQTGPGALLTGNVPLLTTSASAFTYLMTPRFRISPDLMIYARVASGYRPGGPNADAGPGTPPQFDPDKTNNYELGIKADFLDHALSFDASLYYIDWKDIQLTVLNPVTVRSFKTNASRAKSEGVELSLVARPLSGLTVAAWVAWNDAVLTEDFPAGTALLGQARSGDRLPNSSRFSGSLSIDDEFRVTNTLTGFVGASASYVGDRIGILRAGTRQTFPSYTKIDLRLGMARESWRANLFVTNVTDERAAIYGGLGSFPPTAFTYIQPRTVGLSLARNF